MKRNLSLILSAFSALLLNSCVSYVNVSSSESDAEILVDGKNVGKGSVANIPVNDNSCVTIKAEKPGYVTEEVTYCLKKSSPRPPLKKYFELKKDDSYEGSARMDNANTDMEIEISKKYNESEAWKISLNVITNYIYDIESNEKESGYLRTAWVFKTFPSANKVVRTKILVRQTNSSPLKYKLRIISEIADGIITSVKEDDKFREWDRVLKKFSELPLEFQSKLGVK